ncbi:MAG: hypothetical protein OEW24_09485 [Chloroflexota bacterium]|nr:hypothetical protein [Chloroflexota bacterium]
MIEVFNWNIGMDSAGLLILAGGAVVLGVIAQLIGETRTGFEWFAAAVGALVGGWIGSEALGTLSTWGPVVGSVAQAADLYVLPALMGAIVVGVVVDFVVRTMTGGSYVHHARPI